MGEPYSYTLTFGSATDILTKRIRIRIQRRRPVETCRSRPLRVPRLLSRTPRVSALTAVVYEYTLRLSSRHFFTAVKLFVKSEDNVWRNLSIIWDDHGKADLLNDTFVNQNTSINPEAFAFGPTNIKSVFHFTQLSAREVGNVLNSHYPTNCPLVLME